MVDKDSENKVLIDELEKKEAGVKDLFDFYAGIETIYAASIRALEEGTVSAVSNAANHS